MAKRYQVFVSSTFTDLVEERQDALKSILDMGHIPSGMEGFFAADQEQLAYIKKIIDECDYYILIIAGRYGSVDENGVSYTELEYEYAAEKGITVLAFIHDDVANLPASKVDNVPENVERLQAFKEKVSKRRLVRFWRTKDQLKSDIIISLSKAVGDMPGVGWVRGNTVASEDILIQINNSRNDIETLRNENARLRSELSPKIENIAPIEQLFPIRYSYWNDRGNSRYNTTLEMSWADIFKIVGPSFFSPSAEKKIETCIKTYLSQVMREHSKKFLTIFSVDIDTIKLQMMAYGFMSVYSSKSSSGGMAEFIKLTDIGKRTLLELTTSRAAPPTTEGP